MMLGLQYDLGAVVERDLDSVPERRQLVRREFHVDNSAYHLSYSSLCHRSLLLPI
jgi:hypothetical protein